MSEDDKALAAEPGSESDARRADARERGLRTLGQSVLSGVLTYLGGIATDLAFPGFELSYEALAVGMAIAVLTPVLAWLQRRAGK